ncbi:MAG: DUF1294 domain-containing protein [Phycisphaerae bacterium]
MAIAGGLWFLLHTGLLVSWLVGVNCATLAAYGFDKSAARRGALRVPERHLHGLALVGGSPGALLGQQLFRHKTAKRAFQVWFWLILIVQAALLCWWLLRR